MPSSPERNRGIFRPASTDMALLDNVNCHCGDLAPDAGLGPIQCHNQLATPTRNAEELLQLKQLNIISDPMGKLPADIASAIIKLCLPTLREGMPGAEEYENRRLHTQTLFTLAAVSNSWRDFILSESHLWTNISIVVLPDNVTICKDIATDWLKRSGNLPLSIDIYVPYDPMSDDISLEEEDFREFSRIIAASHKRWRYLDLEMPAIFLNMFTCCPSNLHGLRVFNNAFDSNVGWDESYCLSHIYDDQEERGDKPAPIHLSIASFNYERIGISLKNLIRIEASDLELCDVFELILKELPRLEECELEDINCAIFAGDLDDWYDCDPIDHHALRYLRVKSTGSSAGIIYFLFNMLTLPRLETLHIEVLSEYGDPLCRTFGVAALLNRSNCPLVDLTIIGPFTNNNLIRTLMEAPHLRRLTLQPAYYLSEESDSDEYYSYDYTAETLFQLISQTSIRDLSYTLLEDRFLPALESFTYRPNTPKDCQKIWDLIPDLFGVIDNTFADAGNNLDSPLRRPLVDVSVVYKPESECSIPPPLFSEHTWSQIVKLREMGLNIGAFWFRVSMDDNYEMQQVAVITSTDPVSSDF